MQESELWNRNRRKRNSIGMFNEHGGPGGFTPPSIKKHCCRNLLRGSGVDSMQTLCCRYADTLLQEYHPWNRNKLKQKSIGMFNEHGGSGGSPPSMKTLCCRNITRGTGIDLSGSL